MFISFYVSGQTTTGVTAGGEIAGSDGSVSYSVGQVFYLLINDTDANSVTAGVQQAFEISEVSALTDNILMTVSVYPNPSRHLLNVNFGDEQTRNLQLQLFDSYGKLLRQKQEVSKITTIDMRVYARGVYFLRIVKNNQVLKTFKIIKY